MNFAHYVFGLPSRVVCVIAIFGLMSRGGAVPVTLPPSLLHQYPAISDTMVGQPAEAAFEWPVVSGNLKHQLPPELFHTLSAYRQGTRFHRLGKGLAYANICEPDDCKRTMTTIFIGPDGRTCVITRNSAGLVRFGRTRDS